MLRCTSSQKEGHKTNKLANNLSVDLHVAHSRVVVAKGLQKSQHPWPVARQRRVLREVRNWSSKPSQDPSVMEMTRELLSSLTGEKWAPFALWGIVLCMCLSRLRVWYLVSNFGTPVSFLELLRTCIIDQWYRKITLPLCPQELKLFQSILDMFCFLCWQLSQPVFIGEKMETEYLMWERIVLFFDLPGICSLFPAIPETKLCEEMIYQLSASICITCQGHQLKEMFRITTWLSQEEKLCMSKSNFICIWLLCHSVSPMMRKTIICQFSKAYYNFGLSFDKYNQVIVYRDSSVSSRLLMGPCPALCPALYIYTWWTRIILDWQGDCKHAQVKDTLYVLCRGSFHFVLHLYIGKGFSLSLWSSLVCRNHPLDFRPFSITESTFLCMHPSSCTSEWWLAER